VIDRETILGLIPHADRMCLLDRVVGWNADRVLCSSESHRASDHPLRADGQLSAIHLIEYAAQATAVHGGLLARTGSGEAIAGSGVLASVRDLQLQVGRIDDIDATLEITAYRRIAGPGGSIYDFEVSAAGQLLASGRLSVMPGTV
jgi:predicted hotdog family 3-hydroxylacyl-ACP dehydratase